MAGGAVTNLDELDSLLRAQAGAGAVALMVKRGAAGVSVYQGNTRLDVPGFPVEIVNTVGAGDGFAAGLICGWARGWDWERGGAIRQCLRGAGGIAAGLRSSAADFG